MLSRALVTATVLLATVYVFLPTFTDTGHIQLVLSVRKFVSYSALWHTQTRVL
jgi:Fe2+ or Zn2+ uptake regulation protein